MPPNLAICYLFLEEPDDSVHIFTGHTGEVYTVACSPMDASLVATGGGDDKGFLWRIGHEDWAFELQGHGDSICCLAFSTDGRLLASGCLGGLIKIWDIPSQNLKFSLDGPEEGIEWIRWHSRGHLVLAGSKDSIVWMWNADKGACLNTFAGHGGSVTCGDFTPDGKVVCTGSDGPTLRIWDPKSGKTIHVVGVGCVTMWREGRTLQNSCYLLLEECITKWRECLNKGNLHNLLHKRLCTCELCPQANN